MRVTTEKEDGILPSIFPVPGSRSVIAKTEHLLAALDEELLAHGSLPADTD